MKEKLYGLLDLAEMGNFNCLRIWGESEILDDDFYSACDRRGILLWQDFYLGFHMYSEEEEMLSMCRQEAETLVKRLKHHPPFCSGAEEMRCIGPGICSIRENTVSVKNIL